MTLTLVVNGSTTAWLLHALGLDKPSVSKDEVLKVALREMHDTTLRHYNQTMHDDRLGTAGESS